MNKAKLNLIEELKNEGVNYSILDNNLQNALLKVYSNLNNKLTEKSLLIEKLLVVLDTTPCTVSWVTNDLIYEGVNQTLANICNLKTDDFIGKEVGFYTQNLFFKNFANTLFDYDLVTMYQEVSTIINNETKKFWVVGTKYNENKNAVIIGVDITQQRKLEENIAFLDKLSSLGEMVASIVHEINNPLSVIKMRTQKAVKLIKNEQYEAALENMGNIDLTILKISTIISGVKSFVRQGHKDPMTAVNVYELFNEAIAIMEGKLKLNNIKLSLDVNKNLELVINKTQIFQIIINLITNSIDGIESQKEKWIKINFEKNNNSIQVKFKDCGKGISQEVVNNMFDSFYTTKEIGKGTGLGLSLCKKIMNEHKGDLYYELSEDKHTQFVIVFSVNS